MRARVPRAPRPRSRPHALADAARSAFVDVRVLLVFRAVLAAVLVAHTTLFSATGSFAYTAFAAWANALFVLAALLLTFCSLLDLVSDVSDVSDVSEISQVRDVSDGDTSPSHDTSTPVLHRVLPAVATPLAQTAGSASVVAALLHWALAAERVPASRAGLYAAFALHVLNPFALLLDLFLSGRLDTRAVYISLCWVLTALYAGFATLMARFGRRNVVADISTHGTRGYVVAAAIAALAPVAVFLVSRLPIRLAAVCGLAAEKDAASARKRPFDEEAGTDSNDSGSERAGKADSDADSASPQHTTRASSVEKSVFPALDACPPSAAVVNLPAPPAPPAPSGPGSPQLSPVRGASQRDSTRSVGDRTTPHPTRSTSFRLSARSLPGDNTPHPLLRALSSRAASVRSTSSAGSASSWSGVNDVVLEIESEFFRMPGSPPADAVPLPPRVASSRTTSLT